MKTLLTSSFYYCTNEVPKKQREVIINLRSSIHVIKYFVESLQNTIKLWLVSINIFNYILEKHGFFSILCIFCLDPHCTCISITLIGEIIENWTFWWLYLCEWVIGRRLRETAAKYYCAFNKICLNSIFILFCVQNKK